MKTYLGEIITATVTALGGLIAWNNERKKRVEELKASETTNIQTIVDLYQEALDDLKVRYESSLADLKEKYDEKFTELENDIKNMRTNLTLWKGKYRKLKEEFDNYKSKHKKQ